MAEDTGQSITLKIGGRDYPLKVKSPESEQYMRLAAEDINDLLAKYGQIYPQTPLADILVFVALNETVSKLQFRKKLAVQDEACKALEKELATYLSELEKK